MAASAEVSGACTDGVRPSPVPAFRKDLTVHLDLDGGGPVSVVQVLRTIRLLCGGVLGCRQLEQKKYEVTVSNTAAKERLLEGFRMGEHRGVVRELVENELVVSFLNLPVYVSDEEIVEKLGSWGVQPVSGVRRRTWPGTGIADGTRLVRVRFPESVRSLPYSAKFLTATGYQFFRVVHDRQVRVCHQCLQPGHLLRECPDFLCLKCGGQGHYARECSAVKGKCRVCFQAAAVCVCGGSESDSDEAGREVGVGQEAEAAVCGAEGGEPVFGDAQVRGPAKGGGACGSATPELAGGTRGCFPSPAPEVLKDQAGELADLVTGGGVSAATPEQGEGSTVCGAAPVGAATECAWPGGSGGRGGAAEAEAASLDVVPGSGGPVDPVEQMEVSPGRDPSPVCAASLARASVPVSPAVVSDQTVRCPHPPLDSDSEPDSQLSRGRRGSGRRRGVVRRRTKRHRSVDVL